MRKYCRRETLQLKSRKKKKSSETFLVNVGIKASLKKKELQRYIQTYPIMVSCLDKKYLLFLYVVYANMAPCCLKYCNGASYRNKHDVIFVRPSSQDGF